MNETPNENARTTEPEASAPRWIPLSETQRRVLGVLVEKAKTTPDAYPLTVNSITTGSNQKSNRHPRMELDAEDVQIVLDELREMKAVAEIHGSGRVPKYRHLMYDWLGVDKLELAVMAELLLRGRQTVGELRGRAARMETIASLSDLRPILDSLTAKKLVVSVTPAGRGQVVDHGLYQEGEIQLAEESEPAVASAPPVSRAQPSPDRVAALEARCDLLEQRLAALEQRLDTSVSTAHE